MFTSYFTEIKFGFTPIITKSKFLHTVIEQIPITQILSETDSPYFIPEEVRSSLLTLRIHRTRKFRFLVVNIYTMCSSRNDI